MLNCLLCGRECKTPRALGTHISLAHHITTEDYFLSFMGEVNFCKICYKKTTFINIREGFHKFCSTRCSELSEDTKEKKKKNCLKNHGVEYNFQREDVKSKIEETNIEKYGFSSPSKSDSVKNKMKETCLEKYGVEYNFQRDEFKEKTKQTYLAKYGVDHHRKSDISKNKFRVTCLKKYGTNHHLQNEEILNKSKKTFLDIYGVDFPLRLKEIRDKGINTWFKKYGVSHPMKTIENKMKISEKRKNNFLDSIFISDRLNNLCIPLFDRDSFSSVKNYKEYPWKCTTCNTEFSDHIDNGHIPRCPVCFPSSPSGSSKLEKEVCDFCKQYFPNLIENDRFILDGKELDIFISEINLAIEFDGLYWHSEIQGVDKNYHLNKTTECEKKGIQLIHIFENEWWNKREIVQSILLAKMGKIENKIYARKCYLKDITKERKLVKKFLVENHIQGSLDFYSGAVGLFNKEELVFLLLYGSPRYNKNFDIEILRVCSKINTIVIGALTKIMKYISKENQKIISYTDRRYFNGSGYECSGFKIVNQTTPNYFYFKGNETGYVNSLFSRINFQKHKLSNLLEVFDPNLTEWENMQLNGYNRIWDCGNLVFEYIG
mgnify:CR=1 FL=1